MSSFSCKHRRGFYVFQLSQRRAKLSHDEIDEMPVEPREDGMHATFANVLSTTPQLKKLHVGPESRNRLL